MSVFVPLTYFLCFLLVCLPLARSRLGRRQFDVVDRVLDTCVTTESCVDDSPSDSVSASSPVSASSAATTVDVQVRRYLVKWRGQSYAALTWELEDDLLYTGVVAAAATAQVKTESMDTDADAKKTTTTETTTTTDVQSERARIARAAIAAYHDACLCTLSTEVRQPNMSYFFLSLPLSFVF